MATKLDISQLDFDGIKDNLKTFLKQQDEFTDYDFEGSGMNILLDVESVKRSVRNLINLNHYEKPFHPEVGSNLRGMLFENISPQMTHFIGKQIELLIKNYEPRCRLVQVKNQPDLDRNGYFVSINFYVQNHPTPVIVESFLERLR